MRKTIEEFILSEEFGQRLRAMGELAQRQLRIDALREELQKQHSLSESITEALEEEIERAEAEIEEQRQAVLERDDDEPPAPTPAAQPAKPLRKRKQSQSASAASVLGVLSAGFAVAALLAWAGTPSPAAADEHR